MKRVPKSSRAGHGGWEKKIYDNHYSTGIKIPALLGAAGVKPNVRHRNPRVSIFPPPEVVALVWPWIEEWELRLDQHEEGHKRVTARCFLNALKHLRIILLQDAAWFIQRGWENHGLFHIHGTFFTNSLFCD